jgi:glycolate oxidase FAD binding subunit
VTSALHSLDDLRAPLGAVLVHEREGRIVASPRSTEEVAAITRYANEKKLAIEVGGAGTKRGWGNPVEADFLLETSRLTGMRSHSWQDLTATVAVGTPWSAMQRALAVYSQQVALDPLWPETATVGGIIATNVSGALRLKYGSLRDLIIGMTIVLADGTIAKSGGKVVKNVAGYDLHKLMIGALGTLGVITEVTFRLHPIPAQTRIWSICSSDAEPLGKLLMQILNSQLSTQAMQLRAHTEGYALDVELATLPEAVALQLEVLEQLARHVSVKAAAFDDSSPLSQPHPFAAREKLFAPEGGVILKATMLPSAIAALATDVVRLGGYAVTQATGIMFAHFSEDAAAKALPSLNASINAAGDGSLTVLRVAERPVPPWGAERVSPLVREIKRRFDPNRVLNPGRFVGGI